jgi:hypothetical protein
MAKLANANVDLSTELGLEWPPLIPELQLSLALLRDHGARHTLQLGVTYSNA